MFTIHVYNLSTLGRIYCDLTPFFCRMHNESCWILNTKKNQLMFTYIFLRKTNQKKIIFLSLTILSLSLSFLSPGCFYYGQLFESRFECFLDCPHPYSMICHVFFSFFTESTFSWLLLLSRYCFFRFLIF